MNAAAFLNWDKRMISIGILECGRNLERWLPEHGGFADWFPPLLAQADDDCAFRVYAAIDGELPQDPRLCDAWLLTGSPASVYEEKPWQQGLTRFVQQAVGLRPVVGICYGHQHLHAALGGRVGLHESWGVGIHAYNIQAMPEWLSPEMAAQSAGGLRMIALHRDQVVEAAPDTTVLAANDHCPLAITTIGANVLTIQAHPEMTRAQAAEIYRHHYHDIGPAAAQEAIDSLPGALDAALAAHWIIGFIRARLAARDHKGDAA